MKNNKEIEALQRQLFWQELQHKARETYLQRRIEQLEAELINTQSNDFEDK